MRSSSSKTDPGLPPENVLVGEVLRPQGLRGEVIVDCQSDVPGRFAPGERLTLVEPAGPVRSVRVAAVRPYRHGLAVRFEGVEDREGAEGLRGARLEVERSRVPPPPAGSYYHFELQGCRCRDRRAGDLGAVADLIADGGGWLLRVEREDGFAVALPFVEPFLVGFDRQRRVLDWDLPEGLIEACASRS